MEVENIIVIICIWTSGAALGNLQVRGGELYKVVLDRAKELLSSIHEQIKVQQEEMKRKNEQEWQLANQGKRRAIGAKVFQLGAASNQLQVLRDQAASVNAFLNPATSTGDTFQPLMSTTTLPKRRASPFKTANISKPSGLTARSRSPPGTRIDTIQDSLMMNQSQLLN